MLLSAEKEFVDCLKYSVEPTVDKKLLSSSALLESVKRRFPVAQEKKVKLSPQTIKAVEEYLTLNNRISEFKKKQDKISESLNLYKTMVIEEMQDCELSEEYDIGDTRYYCSYKNSKKETVDIVKGNPFVLDKYRGFSFETLDAMSIRFECMPNDVSRCKSALKHYLKTVMLSGNMYANQYVLRENALNVLNARSDSKVTSAEITNVIWSMYNSHELLGENGNVYLPQSYYYEQQTAKYVVEMLEESRVQRYKTENIKKAKAKSESAYNIELSANQLEAVTMALQNPISIITGGAGTGKTTVLKVVLDCLKRLGEKMDNIILAAPTGKAAIRMTDRSVVILKGKHLNS